MEIIFMSWLYSMLIAGIAMAAVESPADRFQPDQNPNTVIEISQDVTETFDQSYPLSSNGRVSVSNLNGSIEITAWDRNEVRVDAVKIADSAETLRSAEIRVDSRPDTIRVSTEFENWRRGGTERNRNSRLEVRYKLHVPRNADLNKIETVNGTVSVSNFTNSTRISVVNGDVIASDLEGNAQIETVNGLVKADFSRVQSTSRISLTTVNGRVELSLPSDVNATLRADTLHGQIKTDLGLDVRKGRYVGQDLHGRIGSGDAQIRLNSVNGALTILRKKDGGSPNQAIDLGGAAAATRIDATKLDEEIARAISEARRTAAQAGRIRVEQLEKLKELEKLKVGVSVEELSKLIAESVAAGVGSVEWMKDHNWSSRGPIVKHRSGVHSVKGTPTVVVDGRGCDVSVRSWDRGEVRYSVSETISGFDDGSIGFSESRDEERFEFKVDDRRGSFAGERGGKAPGRLELYVPRNTNVEISTDRSIRVTGVSGDLTLKGQSEQIDVRDAAGRLTVSLPDGRLRILGFKGDLEMDIGNSDSMIEGDFSAIRSVSDGGTVTFTIPDGLNAKILSNTGVRADDIAVRRNNESEIILGNGGPTYDFRFAGGDLQLRRLSAINAP